MWDLRTLQRIDFRMIPLILALMFISLTVISSHSYPQGVEQAPIFTPLVRVQMRWFAIGWGVFFIFAAFDYNRWREFTWPLYLLVLLALVGIFFTDPIARVQRWYRLPLIHVGVQPSEQAKLIVVMALAWFLERAQGSSRSLPTTLGCGLIVGVPFLLILKQPDLGSALVLYPIALVMFYFGNVHPWVVRLMCAGGLMMLLVAGLLLTGTVDHEKARPVMTKFIKEYQYERLNPNTMHQKASATAIALGGVWGAGWRQGEFSGHGWLPYPCTDSVFPAFGEEFGLMGLSALLLIFYLILAFGFQVTAAAKDDFGRLLSAGITIYLAMHILVNIGMMCGYLPITGVPLILVTYGGSSVIVTMASLGILQSIYSRRFMF